MDDSHGYEAISARWLAGRGNQASRETAIGAGEVRRWAQTLPAGSSIIDVGCGPGIPLTALLVEEGLRVYGLDASTSFVAVFLQNVPGVPIACASALRSDFFGRTFDAILAVGLVFLMAEEEQRHLLHIFANRLNANGRLLFTAPAPPCIWSDSMTGLESLSLGAAEYRLHLNRVGLSVLAEFEDSGGNHYFDARKTVDTAQLSTET